MHEASDRLPLARLNPDVVDNGDDHDVGDAGDNCNCAGNEDSGNVFAESGVGSGDGGNASTARLGKRAS